MTVLYLSQLLFHQDQLIDRGVLSWKAALADLDQRLANSKDKDSFVYFKYEGAGCGGIRHEASVMQNSFGMIDSGLTAGDRLLSAFVENYKATRNANVLFILLKHFPDTAHRSMGLIHDQDTLLHMACRPVRFGRGERLRLIPILLERNPNARFQPNGEGLLPVHYFLRQYVSSLDAREQEYKLEERNYILSSLLEGERGRATLWKSLAGRLEIDQCDGHTRRFLLEEYILPPLLHLIEEENVHFLIYDSPLLCFCDQLELFSLLLDRVPDLLTRRFPSQHATWLHIVSMVIAEGHGKKGDVFSQVVFSRIYRANPHAVLIRDKVPVSTPAHLIVSAYCRGFLDPQCIQMMLDTHPEVFLVRRKADGLSPLHLAVQEDADVSVIYSILRTTDLGRIFESLT